MAEGQTLIPEQQGYDVSQTARRIVSALGYDLASLSYFQGYRQPGNSLEWRGYFDPQDEMQMTIAESSSREAPLVSVAISKRNDITGIVTSTQFVFDRMRNSLLTSRMMTATRDGVMTPWRELIATNFSTGRSFRGAMAKEVMGAVFWPEPVTTPREDLVRLHNRIGEILRRPGLQYAPAQ